MNGANILDSIGAVESVKAASDIYAPVSGIIESINESLADSPSLLNKKPQSDGTSLLSHSIIPSFITFLLLVIPDFILVHIDISIPKSMSRNR